MDKKSSKMPIVIVCLILVIIIVGVLYYLNYSKNNKVEEKNTNTMNYANSEENSTNVNEVENADANELKDLDIESDIVKKLYNYVVKFNCYKEILLYQNDKVELSNISNQLKLLTVLNNLDENDADDKYVKQEEDIEREHLIFTKETVENKAKEIFGADVKINHENCPQYFGYARDYKDGKYDCYDYEGGGGTPWENSINVLEKAEQDNNNIYIYDKYVHLVLLDETGGDGYTSTNYYDIYTGSDRKEKIASKVDISNFEDVVNYENYEESSKNKLEKIEKYTGKEMVTYKHTFKKAEDGSYYWYSTEPLKK